MSRPWRQVVSLITLVAAAGCASPAVQETSRGPERWLISGRSLQLVLQLDPSLRRLFDNPSSFVTGDRFHVTYHVLPIGNARRVATYTNFSTFRAQARSSQLPSHVHSVMYDPEAWSFTPQREQRAPIKYMGRFSRLARGLGYRVVLSPSPDLMDVMDAPCHRDTGEPRTGAYIRCGVARAAARYADVYDVQGQALEGSPGLYRSFFDAATKQAHRTNPSLIMVAQLSTAPADQPVTSTVMVRAYKAVADVSSGIYLYVDPANASVAVDFLRWISLTRM